MFEFRYGHESEEAQERYYGADEYYEVPIVEQATFARLRESGMKDT